MKPIPALDENGDWIEADIVDGSRVLVLAMGDDYAHTLVGNHVWRMDADTFKDWSAVRECVERARRLRALNELTREGQERGEYDPAASKDHGEARIPKRPSFAEALEAEFRTYKPSAPLWAGEIEACIKRARAASGE